MEVKTIEKNNINWDPDANRFICFLDIMGFKDMVYTNDHNLIKDKLQKLSDYRMYIDQRTNEAQNNSKNYKNCDIKSIAFSDTIVLLSNDDSVSAFVMLSYAAKNIFHHATKNGIPLKGAMSYGKIFVDFKNSLFFGKPLISSHLLQEELHYYGVALDHNAESFYLKHGNDIPKNLFYKLKTPLKKGNIYHYNLSLTAYQLDHRDYEALYQTVSGPPRIYVDNTIRLCHEMYEMMKRAK